MVIAILRAPGFCNGFDSFEGCFRCLLCCARRFVCKFDDVMTHMRYEGRDLIVVCFTS